MNIMLDIVYCKVSDVFNMHDVSGVGSALVFRWPIAVLLGGFCYSLFYEKWRQTERNVGPFEP
jgi:hypothetical protein